MKGVFRGGLASGVSNIALAPYLLFHLRSFPLSEPVIHPPNRSSTHPNRWTIMIAQAAEAYDDGNELGALAQFVLAAEQVSPRFFSCFIS